MSSMSRGRKLPNEQNRRSNEGKNKRSTKKMMKHSKVLKYKRSSSKDYSESKSPAAGTSGTIPIVKDGEAGRYSEDGKSVNWADKPNGGMMRMVKKTTSRSKRSKS